MDERDRGKDIAHRVADAVKACPFLNTKRAAFYLGLSSRALEQMRIDGTGPAFRRHGKHIRYHIDDLDAWSRATRSTKVRKSVS